MRFTKMHALANDYIFLDAARDPDLLKRPDLPELARAMSPRHTAVGADGLILIDLPDQSDRSRLAIRIFNSDGSDGGMCGNGARCAVKLFLDRRHLTPRPGNQLTLHADGRQMPVTFTRAGDSSIASVSITLSHPRLDLPDIPVDPTRLDPRAPNMQPREHAVAGHHAVFVNVGNPHMVIFTREDPDELADRLGPTLESHPAFPRRMNIQVVREPDPGSTTLDLRTFERGAGRTRACGTGACAALVAAALTSRSTHHATVRMLGGDLDIRWNPDLGVTMTGDAHHVFDGDWPG